MLNAVRAALIAALCLTPLAAAQTATPESAATATTTSSNEASPPANEAAPQQSTDAAQAQAEAQERAFYDSLHRRTGVIMVAGGKVRLTIPENYYFIGPEDSRRVIVDLWRNPPDAADGIEGMIFPNDNNPATGGWGAIVQYSADGYVSDSDASSQNYEQALHQMQQSIQDGNAARERAGYTAMTLVGWAEPPHYDRATHKIYWGKHLHFGDSSVDTLNYDIRILGREGYLIVSFVAGMPELDSIRQVTPTVLSMADFTPGNRYADYREGVDQRAAYGIGGLIAGGAAAALAQKTGLIALLLAFGKKFIVLIGVALAAAGNFVRRLFRGKPKDEPPTGAA